MHCADGIPKDDPAYAYLKGLQDAGQNLTAEKTLLDNQKGQDGRIYGPLFQYTTGQSFQDTLTQNRAGTRLEGTLQAGVSIAGLYGDGLLCSTGLGCSVAALTGTVLADNLAAGTKKIISGQPTVTYGEQVLQSLGLSPQAAAATYAIVGVTPAAVEALLANKASTAARSVGASGG